MKRTEGVMSGEPPDTRDILKQSVELMDLVIEGSEVISAQTHDSNDELTALATSLWFMGSRVSDYQEFGSIVKMHIQTAFYLGYRVGQKEGDLTIWQEG